MYSCEILNAPRIFKQLRNYFGYVKHQYEEGDIYGFRAFLFEDQDMPALDVSYDKSKELIHLHYCFLLDSPLMFFFLRNDDLPDDEADEIMGKCRAVSRLLPALINRKMDTVWLNYDEENDSMSCNAGIHVTKATLDKKYLERVLNEIMRCRHICIAIFESPDMPSKGISEIAKDIDTIIQSYVPQEDAALG